MSIASVSHSLVFGLRQDIRDNLFSVDDDSIIYPAGSNVIVTQKNTKKFVSMSDKGEGIASITVSPDRHLLAISERSLKPSIHVYEVSTLRKRRVLAPSESYNAKEFSCMSFSADSKYLVAQLSHPEWILHYYAWDKGKLLATVGSSPSPSKILQTSINPFDGSVVFLLGDKCTRFYRYTEGELKISPLSIPEAVFSNNLDISKSFLD